MGNDPYPNEPADPYASDPYSSDPYVPGQDFSALPPAHEPGRAVSVPPPMNPGPGLPPGGPGMPPPYPFPPATAPPNTSAIVLVVLSSLALVTGYCCYIGIPSLILGILGLTKNSTDPEGAARLTKIGWITFASLTIITVLAVLVFVLVLVVGGS